MGFGRDTDIGRPSTETKKTVTSSRVILAAGNYGVNDILADNEGSHWEFSNAVKRPGKSGKITKAQITVETTAQAHRLTLYLFSEAPTSELTDNLVNTGPADADRGFYLGKIDFPALESLGAGNSDTLAVESSPTSGIPFEFKCANSSRILYALLVTRDAFTNETTGDEYKITLTIEQ